jgi:anti-sigma regulatory factor (Ser/Thr protein kinase)/FixJ family two-component response regulator
MASQAVEHKLALLVAGDAEIEQALRQLLEPEGWEIALAPDGPTALELVKQRDFGFIMTGGTTSGAEDVELLRKMRRVNPHTRMIIVTDESTPQDVLDSMREKAFSYFARPFSMGAFETIIGIAMNCPCWDDGIEVVSATTERINLLVRCDRPTADRLLQFMSEATDLPYKERREAGVAFREMLYNAIEHGGQFNPQQYVEIAYERTQHMVTCRIKDPGEGFSLEELKHSALTNPPDDPLRHATVREQQGMRAGGYGVLLARNLVDELLYNEKGNEVLLVKYLEAHPEEGSQHSSQNA